MNLIKFLKDYAHYVLKNRIVTLIIECSTIHFFDATRSTFLTKIENIVQIE